MGKAKNRNAQRIANGLKPKPNVSGKSHKPFIGNAVFTMEDDQIIREILNDYPDTWTLAQIKDALPYSHTFKNITNYLQRLVPPEVIDRHANMTEQPVEPENQIDKTDETVPDFHGTKDIREMLAMYFPQLGEHYTQWPALVLEKTGAKMTRSQIVRAARQAQLAYMPSEWTETENELLRGDGTAFLEMDCPETYVHDIFEHPRTHEQVRKQIATLKQHDLMLEQAKRDFDTTVETANETPHDETVVTDTQNKEKEEPAMPKPQTTTNTNIDNDTKNKEDFIALSNILMNLTPDTEVHVNIKFANGLVVNFEKGALS